MGFEAYLQHRFEGRQGRNPRYSLRAFARDLDCDHATLSQWLRGVRPMTAVAINRVADRLGLGPAAKAVGREFDPLDLSLLDVVADLDAPTTPRIADALGVPVDRVNISINRLLRLGLLQMHGSVWTVIQEEFVK